MTVRLPVDLHAELAKEECRTLHGQMLVLLEDALEPVEELTERDTLGPGRTFGFWLFQRPRLRPGAFQLGVMHHRGWFAPCPLDGINLPCLAGCPGYRQHYLSRRCVWIH